VGNYGAEISNLFICNKVGSIAPERLENMVFQIGRLAFKSLASSDLCLKFKSSMVSALFQAWPGDLYTITNRYVNPRGFYSYTRRQTYMIMGNYFSNFLLFLGNGQSDESANLE
jgi:hypothetical protein